MQTIVKAMIERCLALGATVDDIRLGTKAALDAMVVPAIAPVDRWLREQCDRQSDESATPAVLYRDYVEWCGTLRPTSKQTFGRMLSESGFTRRLKSDGWHWCGLCLIGESSRESVDRWIDEKCEVHPKARLSMKALYVAYVDWGGRAAKSAFNRALEARGFVRDGYVWHGLTTKAALMTSVQLLEQERAEFAARNNGSITP